MPARSTAQTGRRLRMLSFGRWYRLFMKTMCQITPDVPFGLFGALYNAKVYITNNLTATTTGNYGVYSHRDAIGIVIQKNPRSRVWDMGYKFISKIIVDSAR